MASFTADLIAGPFQQAGNTTNYYFNVKLPDGSTGHAAVTIGNVRMTLEQVADALNFMAQGSSYDTVVEQLQRPDGVGVAPVS
jgi:hypothetical protein